MTMSPAANAVTPTAWSAHGATGWLALAASPIFVLMAWIAAHDTQAMPLCSAAAGILPINGMTAMYLLMSLFHLTPWLKLAAARPWVRS